VLAHDRDPDRDVPLPEGAPVALRPLARELYFLLDDAASVG